ncbi:MAG: hypothetical protein ACREYF_28065 [Gammaproteobacteria bacterium]
MTRFSAFITSTLVLLGGMDASRADAPLAVCLSHETIGVAAFQTVNSIDHTYGANDHTSSLIAVATNNLQRFGAGAFTVRSQVRPALGLAGLTRPLHEANTRAATMLLIIGLDAKETRLTSPYFNGDQYPLRTVKLQVSTKVVDARSRDVLTSLEWPVVAYAKNSADEAVSDLLSTDMSDKLAQTMTSACEGRVQATAASGRSGSGSASQSIIGKGVNIDDVKGGNVIINNY